MPLSEDELQAVRDRVMALFHLGETGLPPTWSVGAPLALLAGMIAGVMGWLAGPQPGTRPARNQDQ